MAFDGITIAAVTDELRNKITDGRISKIAQPEDDEILLTIHTGEGNLRLLISADASLPLVYLTENNKQGPMIAPNFCMLLRKHIQGGRIISISQTGLERIMTIEIEHLDEMGDLCRKKLIFELMGKHSNIIFTDNNGKIIDSIKRVSCAVSSVREVLPGRDYVVPPTQDKAELLEGSPDLTRFNESQPVYKAIYGSLKGFSPLVANEVAFRAGVDPDRAFGSLSDAEKDRVCKELLKIAEDIRNGKFDPCVVYESGKPKDFAAIYLTMYGDTESNITRYESMSHLLEAFYREKNAVVRIRQKSADLRHVVQTAIERCSRKYDIQLAQLRDTEGRDKYRLYGELLTAYAYQIPSGVEKAEVDNYYTGEKLSIPLDKDLSASENAQRYFDRYGKLKRTYEAVSRLIIESESDLEHLRSIQTSLDIAVAEEDLLQIRQELAQGGYIKKRSGSGKREKVTSRPFHYISSDGYDIYVGKNNFQNDELTFKFANGGDWWFHAKKIPGSHVVMRIKQGEEVPDRAFEEAARLAAFYSKGRDQDKVEIDYVKRKEVKKPAGAKPGFVVYYTNYSMVASPDISMLKEAD